MRIAIIGSGYVGLVSGACLAAVGHDVVCVDRLHERVDAINAGVPPIYEAGLPELLREVLAAGRFRASTDLAAAVAASTVSILTVGTPTHDGRIDLGALLGAARQVGAALPESYHVVVVKSTVVPGTTAGPVARAIAEAAGRHDGWGLAMNPEFLREGSAVEDFMQPDRIVLGCADDRAGAVLEALYAPFDCPKVLTTPTNAEVIKYASNTLLATLISFSNEIAALCERLPGADAGEVFDALHLDKRLSPLVDGQRVTPGITTYLRPGVGYGGSCLPKDVAALRALASDIGLATPVLDAAEATNARRSDEIVALIEEAAGPLAGKVATVLGLAFKPGTDDMRESPALRLIDALRARGARVRGYDPIAHHAARAVLPDDVELAESPEAALEGAHAALVATAWPEFTTWNWPALVARMHAPVVFDGRGALNPAELGPDALYHTIGRRVARKESE